MDCEAWMPPTQTTAAITKVRSPSVTPLAIREQFGPGCSALLSWPTFACTKTHVGPLRFSNQWPTIFRQLGWAALVRFSTAKRRLSRAGHLLRPGAWQKSCVLGELVTMPASGWQKADACSQRFFGFVGDSTSSIRSFRFFATGTRKKFTRV